MTACLCRHFIQQQRYKEENCPYHSVFAEIILAVAQTQLSSPLVGRTGLPKIEDLASIGIHRIYNLCRFAGTDETFYS